MNNRILFFSIIILPICPTQYRDILSIIIIISLLTTSDIKHIRNPWLSALLLFIPISIFSTPDIRLLISGANVGNLWVWRGLSWVLIYYILSCIINGMCFNMERRRTRIGVAIGISSIISSLYGIAQALGMDQWQYVKSSSEILGVQNPHITAMIGNSTYLSVFLAICLPFVMAYLRWYWIAIVFIGIIICGSTTGLLCLSIAMIPIIHKAWVLLCSKNQSLLRKRIIVPLLIIVSVIGCYGVLRTSDISPNGRIEVWINTLNDWESPSIQVQIPKTVTPQERAELEGINKKTYMLTGRGLGSFEFLYNMKHPAPPGSNGKPTPPWRSAHNEYIESLYSIGIIGLWLVIMSLWFMFSKCWYIINDKFYGAVYISAVICAISAVTISTWHIEPLRFFTVLMFALLMKKIPSKQDPRCT